MNEKIAGFVIGLLLIAFGAEVAWADDKRILDVLLKKGIISQQEHDEILKESKEPVKGPGVAETLKDETPIVSTEEAKPGAKPPPVGSYADLERVPGGIENLRKNEYRNVFTTLDSVLKHNERISVGIVALKTQYNVDNTDRNPGTAAAGADPAPLAAAPSRDENGFRIRAAEIYVTGRLTPWSTYYFEMDFARQSEITLNSMYMDFYAKDMPYLKGIYPYITKLRVGQFREPFGIEQGTSQGLIDFVNRAYYTDLAVGQNGSSVDARAGDPGLNPFGKSNSTGFIQQLDIGIELTHKVPQLPFAPEFQWAVVNGAGRNFNDDNADKDLTGRLALTPTEGMKLYFAGYTGTALYNSGTVTSVLPNNKDIRRTRQGVMYTYIPPQLPELKLQGEYIEGNDNGFRRRTWYQYVLFRPFSFLPNFEPAYRYEQFTVDTNRPNSTLDRHTVGFNYYFHTNVKFTLNYELKHDENEGNPFVTTGGGVANPNNKNFFTTQIQFRY
jgi:hypothetical protein